MPRDFRPIPAERLKNPDLWRSFEIGPQQIAVYIMLGGGMIGEFATQKPADFYLDERAPNPPYHIAKIQQAIRVLIAIAEAHGLDPHDLPTMPRLHNSGIF